MAQIDAAIAHLRAQEKPNYAAAGRLFEIEPTTLRRRFLGLTTSRAQATSEQRQLLDTHDLGPVGAFPLSQLLVSDVGLTPPLSA